MVNMKLDEKEQKEEVGSLSADKPQYPYGLRIDLSDEAIEKLGLVALPSVGSTLILTARVSVSNVSQYESDDSDGPTRSLGLQITDMELGPDREPSNPAQKLYGGGQ